MKFGLQYRVEAHMWIVLHAHKRADSEQNIIMTQRSEEGCRLLNTILTDGSAASPKVLRTSTNPKLVRRSAGSPKVARIVSPKTTRVTRRVPAAPKKAVHVRKIKANTTTDPVTPMLKPKTCKN